MSGQLWAVNSLGGYTYNDNLSDEFREAVQPAVKFRQFCDVKDAAGKNVGEAFHWNVYLNVGTQGGTLVETNTMPETNIRIVQGTLTITEFGNSVPWTGKLETLGKQSIRKPVMKSLKNDAKKAFDIGAHGQFNNTKLRIVPASGNNATNVTLTTNGTATLTNNVAYRNTHTKTISDLMKERNIPTYTDDDYYALGWPSTFRTMKNDLESIHQYTSEGFSMIMNGEIGRYENVRHVEQSHIPKGGAADSSTWNASTGTADAWNNGLSDWIFFFGEDTVAEGIAVAEELRGKLPGDYGRSKGLAWYYLGGFGIVHNDSSFTDQCRIIKWDSAA